MVRHQIADRSCTAPTAHAAAPAAGARTLSAAAISSRHLTSAASRCAAGVAARAPLIRQSASDSRLAFCRRQVATAALSVLPHYADLPLDKATHLRNQPETLRALFNRPDARLVVFWGREGLVAPADQSPDAADSAAHHDSSAAAVEAAEQASPAATPDSQTTWQQPELKWRPAYLTPAAAAQRFGYLSGQRSSITAGGSGAGESGSEHVNPAGAVFLGLDGSGAPVFAADLGPEPPLWPDSRKAQAAAAAALSDTASDQGQEGWQSVGNAFSEAAAAAGDASPDAAGQAQSAEHLAAWAAERGFQFVDIRRQGPHMSPGDAAIMALANGVLGWHRSSAFAGTSGAPLTMSEGGYSRRVIAPADDPTRPSLYPRIDPAVIMAVTSGDHILLGRQGRWVEGRYSLLAGFCEIGETLEQAVVRETREEAGIEVDLATVRYHSSQPWPFPQSLMLGFTARAAAADEPHLTAEPSLDVLGREGKAAAQAVGLIAEELAAALGPPLPRVACNDAELADARWFSRSWLRAALSGSRAALAGQKFAVPGTYSLAGRIIHQWLHKVRPPSGSSGSSSSSTGGGAGQAPDSESPASDAGESKNAALLDRVADVQIGDGTFKYVLLRVSTPDGQTKVIVRGHLAAGYHNDILQATSRKLQPAGFQVDVLGGGRISHDPAAATVHIYGYSSAFGPAPHEVSAALLRRWLPLHAVTTSYEGY